MPDRQRRMLDRRSGSWSTLDGEDRCCIDAGTRSRCWADNKHPTLCLRVEPCSTARIDPHSTLCSRVVARMPTGRGRSGSVLKDDSRWTLGLTVNARLRARERSQCSTDNSTVNDDGRRKAGGEAAIKTLDIEALLCFCRLALMVPLMLCLKSKDRLMPMNSHRFPAPNSIAFPSQTLKYNSGGSSA